MGSSPSTPARPKAGVTGRDDPSAQVTLSLHLGAHKTASTHLQRILRSHTDMLAEDGLTFYGPKNLRRKGGTLRHLFGLNAPVDGTPDRTPPEQLSFMARHGTRVVVSEENFWGVLLNYDGTFRHPVYPMAANRVRQLTRNVAPHRVQLFIALRDPASFLTSGYSQTLFAGYRLTLEDYLRGITPLDLRWSDLIKDVADVGGLADIFVWRYEDYDVMWRHILRRMTRWRLGPKFEPLAEQIHPGISGKAMEIVQQKLAAGEAGDFVRPARKAWPISAEHPRYQPWSEDMQQASLRAYAEDVERIAEIPGVTLLRPQIRVKPSGPRKRPA